MFGCCVILGLECMFVGLIFVVVVGMLVVFVVVIFCVLILDLIGGKKCVVVVVGF